MSFSLTADCLRRLYQINSFPLPGEGIVFFGLRGCLPVNADDHEFHSEAALILVATDYIHPRCTLGQWLPSDGKIALFPGSTVPHRKYIKTSLEKDGRGTNQMMTGLYHDYRKGVHKMGSPTGHRAFKQTKGHPIRRTADDFDFDSDDRVEFTNPYDNIHAAWSMGVNHNEYASAGCQVVVGYPQCIRRDKQPDAGPWKVFKENGYRGEQESFPYLLLNGLDAKRVALMDSAKMSARLRYGSTGDLVREVQKVLNKKGYYEGRIDGDFGPRMLRSLLDYQAATFGHGADDGIVGPITASSMGIDWPEI
jgi:hypothetical protein